MIIGEVARIAVKVTNAAAAPITPTSVRVWVRRPSAAVTEVAVTADLGAGAYHADVDVDQAGQWGYRIQTTTPKGAHEGRFVVRPQEVFV